MDNLTQATTVAAQQTMLAQAINSNNLANASTTGFRADLALFSGVLADQNGEDRYQPQAGVDTSPGAIHTTGRQLDVAIQGDGWIAIQGRDGNEAYTRRGDLHVDSQGQLTNGAGLPILGNGGPIAIPPYSEIAIGTDGTISIQALGQAPNSLAVIDRIKLVDLDEMQLSKGEDGLLRLPPEETAVASAEVQLLAGALEGSNVNPVESMVTMISLARRFEMQIKLLSTSAENSTSMDEVMRIA